MGMEYEVRCASDLPQGDVIRDCEINICGEVKLSCDTVFENCEISFLGSKGGKLSVNKGRLSFYDCALTFERGGSIFLKDADLEMSCCNIEEYDPCVGENSEHLMPLPNELYPHIIAVGNKRNISLLVCSAEGLNGPLILSYGTNVYLERCDIERQYGMFLLARSGNYDSENYLKCLPVCSIRDCSFENCVYVPWKKGEEYLEPKHLCKDLNTSMIRDNSSSTSALIVTVETVKLTVRDTDFKDCDIFCIVANDSHGDALIKDCSFEKCGPKNADDFRNIMPVQLSHIKALVEDCKFSECVGGLYYHGQCYGLTLKDSNFSWCSGYDSWRHNEKGILYIFTENEEIKSYIEDCTFESCQTEGPVVCIQAVEPTSRQRGNVIMKGCSFVTSSYEDVIKSVATGSGFFGSRVDLLNVVDRVQIFRY